MKKINWKWLKFWKKDNEHKHEEDGTSQEEKKHCDKCDSESHDETNNTDKA